MREVEKRESRGGVGRKEDSVKKATFAFPKWSISSLFLVVILNAALVSFFPMRNKKKTLTLEWFSTAGRPDGSVSKLSAQIWNQQVGDASEERM